jgi:signal peptidase I
MAPNKQERAKQSGAPAAPRSGASSASSAAGSVEIPLSFLGQVREFAEALILAFIVAMFFRAFVVELFRIPSGSMSPTLIGDWACELDVDGNGEEDQIVFNPAPSYDRNFQVFYKVDGKYRGVDNFDERGRRRFTGEGRVLQLTPEQIGYIKAQAKERYDRILVNKFYFWAGDYPERGDIMVFKVPPSQFQPHKPIYIKRVAATGGESVRIDGGGDLIVDGEKVTEPEVHDRVFYASDRAGPWYRDNAGETVPDGTFLAFGDNSTGSLDSRAWGPVPVGNLKGLAIFRYWPFNKRGFIDNDI